MEGNLEKLGLNAPAPCVGTRIGVYTDEDRRLIEGLFYGSGTVLMDGVRGFRRIAAIAGAKPKALPQTLWQRIWNVPPKVIQNIDMNFFLGHGSLEAVIYCVHKGKVVVESDVR